MTLVSEEFTDFKINSSDFRYFNRLPEILLQVYTWLHEYSQIHVPASKSSVDNKRRRKNLCFSLWQCWKKFHMRVLLFPSVFHFSLSLSLSHRFASYASDRVFELRSPRYLGDSLWRRSSAVLTHTINDQMRGYMSNTNTTLIRIEMSDNERNEKSPEFNLSLNRHYTMPFLVGLTNRYPVFMFFFPFSHLVVKWDFY